jgi:hypothetical protein
LTLAFPLASACGPTAAPPERPHRAPPAPAAPTLAQKAAAAPWWAAAPAPADQPVVLGTGASLLTVDLSDGWAPSIFADAGPADPPATARPNRYRQTFVDLANDRLAAEDAAEASTTHALDPDAPPPPKGAPPVPTPPRRRAPEPVRNYLEVFGIPPTLSVLLARLEADAGKACFAALDRDSLARFDGNVTYQSAKDARREADEVAEDEAWLAAEAEAPVDPRAGLRLLRLDRGRSRLRAIKAAQARLACEGLLGEAQRYTPGVFDRPTHEALARWERKNDVFGWGFLGGETTTALARPPLELHFETFRRILTERVADAAGIIEDGTVPGTRNLIGEHVSALLAALAVKTPEDLAGFLRAVGSARLGQLRVAIAAPALPAYYASHMELEVEIDRGDVFYDLPAELQAQVKPGGKGVTKVLAAALEQKRERFPTLTLFVRSGGERLPLARWRTTIGSWRSEIAADGNVYYKYKNSDVGPRIWKHVVAGPVWVPPDSAPVKDLLTKKVFDVRKGPVDVVNTEIMGPGFHSAYGLVMAIHHKVLPGGALFDNQIRTHGSVDYTSIAQRFSHGCHRLVNTRAVRLFDFVLRHRTHVRLGDSPLGVRRLFAVEGRRYGYELTSRGYYYELKPPLPVEVLEGRIKGRLQQPVTNYVRKPGVVYVQRSVPAPGEADSISP